MTGMFFCILCQVNVFTQRLQGRRPIYATGLFQAPLETKQKWTQRPHNEQNIYDHYLSERGLVRHQPIVAHEYYHM